MSSIILVGIFITIGLLSLLSKHRSGIGTIALAASSIMASLWAKPLADIAGPHFSQFSPDFIVAAMTLFITITPAFFLLFSGYKYRSIWQRIFGAVIFGGVAFLLLGDSVGQILVLDDGSREILQYATTYRSLGLTLLLALAFMDILLGHATKYSNTASGKHKK